SLLGYCLGGTMALLYTARYPEAVKNLILMATPLDFQQAGLLAAWADKRYFDADKLIDAFGNLPAEMLQWSFMMLKPATNFTKYVNIPRHLQNKEYIKNFIALETWANDNVTVPGELYRRLVKDLYQENQLAEKCFRLAGETIDLSNIRASLLNVIASNDHIVPPPCSAPLLEYVASQDKEQALFPYGHIALTVSNGAIKEVWPKTADWLQQRSGDNLRDSQNSHATVQVKPSLRRKNKN
ncbi:MAG: alpha/beta fold hydrolase, partial [Acidobacteriota bacterium]